MALGNIFKGNFHYYLITCNRSFLPIQLNFPYCYVKSHISIEGPQITVRFLS
jgi:hypothetical protein